MQQYRRWFSYFAVLVLGLVIGLIWNGAGGQAKVGAKETGGGDNGAASLSLSEKARLMEAADIVEIKNLQSEYSNALDAGRLDDVADMNTETGGRGIYYQDPVTTHLVVTGHPVDTNGQPLKDFPGCIMFGRENVTHFLVEGGESIRPHVIGWPGGIGKFPGKAVSRHVILNKWVRVTGNTATLHDYYGAGPNSTISESDLVRTPKGWKFQFRKVIFPKPTPERACTIADPKFPIPPAGSPGGVPNFLTPN